MPDARRRCKSRCNQMIREIGGPRLADRLDNSLSFELNAEDCELLNRERTEPHAGAFSPQVQIATIDTLTQSATAAETELVAAVVLMGTVSHCN
jgi:hypothetical protein